MFGIIIMFVIFRYKNFQRRNEEIAWKFRMKKSERSQYPNELRHGFTFQIFMLYLMFNEPALCMNASLYTFNDNKHPLIFTRTLRLNIILCESRNRKVVFKESIRGMLISVTLRMRSYLICVRIFYHLTLKIK